MAYEDYFDVGVFTVLGILYFCVLIRWVLNSHGQFDLTFSANKPFFGLNIVQGTALAVFGIAWMISILIAGNTDLYFDPSSDGFNAFYDIFKFPIAILALLIPIGAVYAANHRSVISTAQYNTQLLFDHRLRFSDHLKVYLDDTLLSVRNSQLAHTFLFPGGQKADHDLSFEYITNLNGFMSTMLLKRDMNSGELSNLYDEKIRIDGIDLSTSNKTPFFPKAYDVLVKDEGLRDYDDKVFRQYVIRWIMVIVPLLRIYSADTLMDHHVEALRAELIN